MGRVRHPRNLQHHALAREDLFQRGHRAGAVLRSRRGVRHLVRRQEGQVSEAAVDRPAQALEHAPLALMANLPCLTAANGPPGNPREQEALKWTSATTTAAPGTRP